MSSIGPNSRPKILVFLGRYLPGFNSGGPVRTISCMVEALAQEFDFYIVTLNRDAGSKHPYTTVRTGSWNPVGMSQVFYTPSFSLKEMRRLADELRPDVIYFNGFFSTSTVLGLLKRKLGGLKGVPVVLATRGDLASGALGLKSQKKKLYIEVAKLLGLYKNLLWQASSERERSEMLRELRSFGIGEEDIHVAPDLGFGYHSCGKARPKKIAGEASFITVGRITRMKNLPFTIDRLRELKGKISLDIIGPLEDRGLWSECEAKIKELPANVTVRYHGAINPDGVVGELATRHFFILPTLGENYGHVIVEGAAAGCPIVISDRTQWLGLPEREVGWDIPLENVGQWRSVLQNCVDMNEEQFQIFSQRASDFGRSVMNSAENVKANVELFRRALRMRGKIPGKSLATGVGT